MSKIAGLEVGRPERIEDVTPEWLTTVFRTSGAIGESTRVSAVEAEPFAVGLGFLSLLNRVRPTYEGPAEGAPEAVIVKMETDLEVQRGLADALSFYDRELSFYRQLAPDLDLRTPKVHAAMMSEANTDFAIVMEDLSGLRGLDQVAGVSGPDATLAVEGMATFHAHFWENNLEELSKTFPPFDNPVYRHGLPAIFEAGWPNAKEKAADLLPPEIVAFGDRFAELVPFFLEGINGMQTIVHGDWRADNLLVDENGELAVIDFQITGTAIATYDLAYFMSQSLEPEVRQPINDELKATYYDALSAKGVTYDKEQMERVFRLATAWCLIYPVANFPDFDELPENTQIMARTMLHRAVTSILDHGSLGELPS